MTLLFPIMWLVILTQSWTGLELNPILEIPIMKIARNLYQPPYLALTTISWVTVLLLIFKATSPTPGSQSLGLMVANLQLYWVLGTSHKVNPAAFKLLTWYFKQISYQHVGSTSEKLRCGSYSSWWRKALSAYCSFGLYGKNVCYEGLQPKTGN